ncbi:MAG: hypothetical protein ACTTJ7_01620 [Treponema sp.]
MYRRTHHTIFITLLFIMLLPVSSCSSAEYSDISVVLPEHTAPQQRIQLTALNKNAVTGTIHSPQKDPYLYFTFDQAADIHTMLPLAAYSLEINVEALADENAHNNAPSFFMAFLYDTDFTPDTHKLTIPLSQQRPKVIGNIRTQKTFSVSMGFASLHTKKAIDSIRGFIVYAKVPIKINSIAITQAQYGWTYEQGHIWCGFDADGGSLPSELFSAQGIPVKTVLPPFAGHKPERIEQVRVLFNHLAAKTSTAEYAAQVHPKIEVQCGDNRVFLSCEPSLKGTSINSHFFSPQQHTVLLAANAPLVSGIVSYPQTVRPATPIMADPAFVLQWPQEAWRNPDYELFAWEQFPSVLVFDFATYAAQDLFFKRLAFYAEKKGFVGQLLTDQQLQTMHGYNAHDYKADTLAAFFDKAEKEGFSLHRSELLLQEILFENGLIVRSNGSIQAGHGAVISISRESNPSTRQLLLTHESLHGVYFTQKAFRDAVDTVFNAMDTQALLFLQRYFEVTPSLHYDTDDQYLFKNEFMAYTLQQPIEQVQSYYVEKLATRKAVSAAAPALCAYIQKTNAAAFKEAASKMNDFLFKQWGIVGGRINQAVIQKHVLP